MFNRIRSAFGTFLNQDIPRQQSAKEAPKNALDAHASALTLFIDAGVTGIANIAKKDNSIRRKFEINDLPYLKGQATNGDLRRMTTGLQSLGSKVEELREKDPEGVARFKVVSVEAKKLLAIEIRRRTEINKDGTKTERVITLNELGDPDTFEKLGEGFTKEEIKKISLAFDAVSTLHLQATALLKGDTQGTQQSSMQMLNNGELNRANPESSQSKRNRVALYANEEFKNAVKKQIRNIPNAHVDQEKLKAEHAKLDLSHFENLAYQNKGTGFIEIKPNPNYKPKNSPHESQKAFAFTRHEKRPLGPRPNPFESILVRNLSSSKQNLAENFEAHVNKEKFASEPPPLPPRRPEAPEAKKARLESLLRDEQYARDNMGNSFNANEYIRSENVIKRLKNDIKEVKKEQFAKGRPLSGGRAFKNFDLQSKRLKDWGAISHAYQFGKFEDVKQESLRQLDKKIDKVKKGGSEKIIRASLAIQNLRQIFQSRSAAPLIVENDLSPPVPPKDFPRNLSLTKEEVAYIEKEKAKDLNGWNELKNSPDMELRINADRAARLQDILKNTEVKNYTPPPVPEKDIEKPKKVVRFEDGKRPGDA